MITDMNEDMSYAAMAWVSYTQRKVEQSRECLEDVCKSQNVCHEVLRIAK